MISAITSGAAFLLSLIAIAGVENGAGVLPVKSDADGADKPPFMEVLRETWADVRARRFTVFVFVSMLAYSAQDLILEPFAGIAFGFTPGESTQLASVQHGGVLVGMFIFAIAVSALGRKRPDSLR